MQEELQAIGQILREAREAKGLSLAEVEARTKISIPVLGALEEGDTSRLPHPVYAKGFLRSYAGLLGLDGTDLCARFARAYPVPDEMEDAPEERAAHIRVTVRHPEDEDRWRPWAVRVAGGLVAVVVAVGGWYGFQWYILPQVVALRQAATLVTQPANETVPAASSTLPAPQETSPTPGASADAPVVHRENASLNASAASEEEVLQAVPPAAANASSEKAFSPGSTSEGTSLEETTPAPQSQSSQAVTLRIMRVEATADCWMQAKTDDKVTDYFLRQGERVDLRFASSLRLKLGNAAGVRLWLDGQAFPVGETRPGEVRTISVP
ncbi:MAG: cytoskeleton protein RodZ [Desulfomicrobiaceae bacterium]|nr:cytoskeleton protein RodZ [Desulfomicrobiaceae bacterium]